MRDKKVEWGGTDKKDVCLVYLNKTNGSLWAYEHTCLMWLPAPLSVDYGPLFQYYWSKLLHKELLPFLLIVCLWK